METTEAGLTKEEKVMFSILGVILIVAVAFLIVWNFSNTDRQLKEENTPVSEPVTKEEDANQEVIEDVIIEEVVEEDEIENVTNSVTESDTTTNIKQVSNKSENTTKNTINQSKDNTQQNSTELSTPNEEKPIETIQPEQPEEELSWNLPTTIINEAIEEDFITIDKNIVLSNGTTQEAIVEIKKFADNTYNTVAVINNGFIAEKGIYKYYYTYKNETKEELLIVKERLKNIEIRTLSESIQYVDNTEFTEQEFNNIIENSKQTTINKNNNIYEINVTRVNKNTNKVALMIDFNENIESATTLMEGVEISSLNPNIWQENYTTGELRLLLDFDKIPLNEVIKLNVYYNGQEGIIELKLTLSDNIIEEDNAHPEDDSSSNESSTETSNDEEKSKKDDEEIIEESTQETSSEKIDITPEIEDTLNNDNSTQNSEVTQTSTIESIADISNTLRTD